MAIDGLIILEPHGRPVIQTSFKSTSQAYPLLHIDALTKAIAAAPNDQTDPILYVSTDLGPSACFHMEVGPSLRMLCPVTGDIQPLYVFSFMQMFCDTLRDYLGEITSSTLREHFDIVYQLLEEMLDNGYPLTTERSALRDIVIPPSLLNSIISKTGISGLSKASANPFNSPIPWRKSGIKHTANEILFDISEDMRAIVDKSGSVLSSQVWGKIEGNSRLSGVPDLTLTFADSKILHDVSFHQCVRLQRWTRDKTISFVPPDGHFELMSYRYAPAPTSAAVAPRQIPVPFSFTHSMNIESNGGTFNFHLTSKLTTRSMDRIVVELHLGEGATGANCTATSESKWIFDPRTLRLKWEIVNVSQGSSHQLKGSFTSSKTKPKPGRAFQLSFDTSMYTFSGLKIDQLRLTNEAYKPYKGVKGRSKGLIEWRM